MTAKKTNVQLGIIGGSGFYQMPLAKIINEHSIKTPFGDPSDHVTEMDIHGKKVFFLPRHGKGHRFTPSEVNYRANIHALKELGVTHLIGLSAVGIMLEHISPGYMVIPDQLYDRTKGIRASTFFGDGVVGHVSFADPFCSPFRELMGSSANSITPRVHMGGVYVCMEGPQFSTRAESQLYRQTIHPAVIGMTAIPEAKLAREAEMCYGMLALATDYDCWHESEEDVNVDAVIQVLKENSVTANQVVAQIVANLPATWQCSCQSAAKNAIMTDPRYISQESREKLKILYGKYLEDIS